jgi:hypothetical protein
MILAADYPLLDIFWTMLIFFGWVIWFWILVTVLTDIFRRHDIGGGSKTLWTAFVIVLPFLGVFIYMISQGTAMAERRANEVQSYQAAADAHIRNVASTSTGTGASEIAKAKGLLDSGVIDQAEFARLKERALTA